jgi:hypothetical protein
MSYENVALSTGFSLMLWILYIIFGAYVGETELDFVFGFIVCLFSLVGIVWLFTSRNSK